MNVQEPFPGESDWQALTRRDLSAESAARFRAALEADPSLRGSLAELVRWELAWRASDAAEVPGWLPALVARTPHPLSRTDILRIRWRMFGDVLAPLTEALAAADGQTADGRQRRNAAGSGFLRFAAALEPSDPAYWCARIALPPHPAPETVLRVVVTRADGSPMRGGTFELCGLALALSDQGVAVFPLSEFRARIARASVLFRPADGGAAVPGEPQLGFLERG